MIHAKKHDGLMAAGESRDVDKDPTSTFPTKIIGSPHLREQGKPLDGYVIRADGTRLTGEVVIQLLEDHIEAIEHAHIDYTIEPVGREQGG